MKTSDIYSFSASTAEDKELVERLKQQCIREGKKFNFVVLQALKAYDSKKKKAN